MSNETELLEVDKYISSKLWYTPVIALQQQNDNFVLRYNNDIVDFVGLESAIVRFIHAQCDNHHQWMMNVLLQKLVNITSDIEHVKREQQCMQMQQALQLCKHVTTYLEQGLLGIYKSTSENVQSEIFTEMCSTYSTFLRQNVQSNPIVVCWIMNELLLISLEISDYNFDSMQKFNFSFFKELLELTLPIQPSINEDSLGYVLCVLSKMNVIDSNIVLPLNWLFLLLSKIKNTSDLQFALYARGNEYFFKKWCICFGEINNIHIKSSDNLNDILKIQNTIFHTSTSSCIINKNILVERIVNNKLHWIEDIMAICHTLMINGKYNDVTLIMSNHKFESFWLVLLFDIMNHCMSQEVHLNNVKEDYDFIFNSIELLTLMCNFPTLQDSALIKLQNVLQKSMIILGYILDCRQQTTERNLHIENVETTMLIHQEQKIFVEDIFHFQHFNSLLMLKMATNLHEQSFDNVQNLLEDLHEPQNTFYVYCAMLNAVKAILICDSYDSKQTTVINYLENMKHFVLKSHPLSLRMQVIEDIFCLLFLRYEIFDYNNRDNVNSFQESVFENKLPKQDIVGFICNEHIVRNVLLHLKDIITTTEVECIQLKHNNAYMEEIAEIEKRIVFINTTLSEATWRLELYTTEEFHEGTSFHNANRNYLQDPRTPIIVNERLTSIRFTESLFFYQEDISDKTKIRSNSSSDSESLHNNNKWRKRNKNIAVNTTMKDVTNKPFFINFMLASKESLIIRCLWKNDYTKMEDIIKVSDLKNPQLIGEVQFSKSLHSFKREMSKQNSTLYNEHQSVKIIQSPTVENIRMTVQEGAESSRQTSQFETFLVSQESNLQMLCTRILKSNEILTICSLDLVLNICLICPTAYNLCEVALKYLKLCKTIDNTEYAHLFYKFYHLLHEKKDELSLESIFCDSIIPFSFKEYKEKEDFWKDTMTKHHEFKESQENKNVINMTLKDSNCLPSLKVLGKIAAGCYGTKKYIQNLFSHLQLLHSIIPSDHTIVAISELLKIPLHYYIGYQIFELNIEPCELDTIAHDMQVNLAYSILINACPKFLYDKNIQTNKKNSTITTAKSGCIILNETSCKTYLKYERQGPNECVSNILSELLKVLDDLNLHQPELHCEICKNISKHPNLQIVLNKTSCLKGINLCELSEGHETLTFLLNTWNLMFLHTSLTVWANQTPFNSSHHRISLMSVGYLIADLGFVTLAALRRKLLKNIGLDKKTFFHIDELNEPAWQNLEIIYDPRVIFAMANEYYGTPYIRVYHTQSIEQDLATSFYEYLNYYSKRCDESKQNIDKQGIVLLPTIAEKYENFISNIINNDLQNNEGTNKNLPSIKEYVSSCNQDVTVRYIPSTYVYSILLKYPSSCNVIYHKNSESRFPWKTYHVRTSLLQYLDAQCWILSYLLQRILNENPTILENNCDHMKRVICLENLLSSSWLIDLKPLYDNNRILPAIFEAVSKRKLWSHFEVMLNEDKWCSCLDLVKSLPNYTIQHTELQYFKEKLLSNIISEKESTSKAEILKNLYQIKDVYVLYQTILHNINKWQVPICESALYYTVYHTDVHSLPRCYKLQLNEILHKILVFNKMLPYCLTKPSDIWYDIACCTEKVEPLQIIKLLIEANMFDVCLEWMECQSFTIEIHPSVTEEFLIGLLQSESQEYSRTLKFLHMLPLTQSVDLCKAVLKKLESIDSLKFICNYLLEYCKTTETIIFRKMQIGIDILSLLNTVERMSYIHLIKDPLLMLEQLLMNCKFESIQRILDKMQEKLDHANIKRSDFDAIIRFYAKKSLDCRVSLQCENTENKLKNMQSLSTVEAENTEFVIPVLVPTKAEWIPNEMAKKCSCCRNTIFSMFNRRHHCRRCGRVICATCSQHRMQVSGYPSSVLVRVCDDCKRQTVLQTHVLQGTSSTSSSEIFDSWRLSRDEKHNETIREEFSFEYAPNISLCLAILNLHSEHKTYTSFLLDCCDEMKRLLQPVSGGRLNPEVDHAVIIKMIRSLLIAVKVKWAKLGLNTGLTHCDRFLSQVDLIATLVQSDCLHLIPSDNLDGHTLRKLRDLLIEKEQWALALDVSTKAGLDTQGVWATWGKACLKMGYFDQAQDKFLHCLDKVHYESSENWVILPYSIEFEICNRGETSELNSKKGDSEEFKSDESNSKKIEFPKNRPLKDPPLLTEILQILENLRVYKQYIQHTHQSKKCSTSQEILSNLGNFKFVYHKQYNVKNVNATHRSIHYTESLDYLLNYGSYTSILEFLLNYGEYDKCLSFTLENDLDPDLFWNAIYLYCLTNGIIEELHESMTKRDSSLQLWKKYLIHVCHSLERKQYFNILYQLQLFMKDSIRAAMTCIRFYLNEASNYMDLCAKSSFLLDAQKHLETELKVKSLNQKRRKSTTYMHSNPGVLVMEMEPSEIDKHINTICSQMEITKFLANCEKEGRAPIQFLNFLPNSDTNKNQSFEVPTLFGNEQQKINLAVLAIICGRNIEEGFGIGFRIMQDYNLPQQKVYSIAGHILTMNNNTSAVEQLIKCCHTSGSPNSHTMSDYVLLHCITILQNRLQDETDLCLKNDVCNIVKLISNVEFKINTYIKCKQLKAAYLLAVKHSRVQDVKKILKESDRLGQNAIKAICIKWLQQQEGL